MTTNLERWRYYLKDIESPDLYVNWTFYFLIGAALERRVCLNQLPHETMSSPLFANQYLIFIGPTRVGKSTAADKGLELFMSYGGFDELKEIAEGKRIINVAPSSSSLEGLFRYMNENIKTERLNKYDPIYEKRMYGSTPLAFFATKELATLLREHTDDVVHFLSQGWECGDFHRNTKGAGVDFIKYMCLSLFGCATPDWIRDISKTGLLKAGFAARTIFVWGGKRRHRKLLYEYDAEQKKAFLEIKKHVIALKGIYGAARFTDEAFAFLREWYEGGEADKRINQSKAVDDYYANKKLHVIKIAMAMHFADSLSLTIPLSAIQSALRLLEETEKEMHLALLGTNADNPAAKVAGLIEQSLEINVNGSEWIREGFLLGEVYNACLNGRETFQEAIDFLQETGRIEVKPLGGKPHYRLTPVERRINKTHL